MVDNVNIVARTIDKVNHLPETAGDSVLELMHSLVHQVRSRQFEVLKQGNHGITQMEMRVLNYFAHHPGDTQRQLVEFSGRDKAQLARLIKGLREREMLEVMPSEGDQRNVHLRLTAQGEAMQLAVKRQGKALAVKALQGFSTEERGLLTELLRRIADNLE